VPQAQITVVGEEQEDIVLLSLENPLEDLVQ
jgi:hypothetical protein